MSLAPSISPITAQPLPGGVNPFDWLPRELVETILDRVDTKASRLKAELTCRLFSSFATELFEKRVKWLVASASPQPRAVESLYPIFKKRMRQLHVEFPSHSFMAHLRHFNRFFLAHLPPLVKEVIPTAREFVDRLSDEFLDDVILSYADQDILKITPENYTKTTLFLIENFPRLTPTQVRTLVRKGIKKFGTEQHAQRTAEIEKIRCEFANPAPDAVRFLQVQRSLIADLEKRKEPLEKRRLELCSPDGLIDVAKSELQKIQNEIAFAVRLAGADMKRRSEELASDIASGKYPLNSVQELYAITDTGVFILQNVDMPKYLQKMAKLNELLRQFNEIARYDQSDELIGGELFVILQALQPDAIARRARFETKQKADFFKELNRDVAEGEEIIRSQALSAICERKPQ